MVTQQEADRFMKNGRIGRILIKSYNGSMGTQHRLIDCTFRVERRDVLRVVVDLPDGRRSSVPVSQLHVTLGSELTPLELAFCKQFDQP